MRASTAPQHDTEERAGDTIPLVVFRLDGRRYGLPLVAVRRSLRALALTPLPGSPDIVLGLFDLAGEIIPAVDTRARFDHTRRGIHSSDHLIVADTGRRIVALLVDETEGVVEAPAETLVQGEEILKGLAVIQGAVKLPEGLILIHDLGRLLSLEEEGALESAINRSNEKR